MICKYSLDINGLVYQFGSECIKNWDEISCELKRKEHGGTLSSFSSSFQFVGEAYNLLLKEYIASYLYSKAQISIYMMDNNLSYKRLYSARLDFGSLRVSDSVLSINSFDDSVANIIKTKASTQYEFAVSDIKEPQQLYYDRVQMKSDIRWIDGGTIDENDSHVSFIDLPAVEGRASMFFPLSIKSSEICVKNTASVNDVLEYRYKDGTGEKAPFFVALDDIEITININFKAKSILNERTKYVNLQLEKWNYSGGRENGRSIISRWTLQLNYTTISLNKIIKIKKGETLNLDIDHYSNNSANKIIITDFVDFSITYNAIDKPVMVDVIRPQKLLDSLLGRIQDGIVLTGQIDVPASDARLSNALIVAAESVRGISPAKVYTSYRKFCEWMEVVFGYVQVIEGKTVKFVHRNTLFSDKEPVDAGRTIVDVSLAVDNSLIYSSLKVGYDKKDYDSVNGRDEFRWSTEYETGIDIKSSVCSLISPYRADAYGIEFLAAKRGEETSDTDSDTDVFFVSATLTADRFILDRGNRLSGVISPSTMFNAMYSPRSIIKANERFLAATIDKLVFASSEGNSDVTIDDVKETSDYLLQNKLFGATILKFKSASNIKCSPDTLIRVSNCAHIYEGYIDERSCKYGRYDGVDYKLLVKKII